MKVLVESNFWWKGRARRKEVVALFFGGRRKRKRNKRIEGGRETAGLKRATEGRWGGGINKNKLKKNWPETRL